MLLKTSWNPLFSGFLGLAATLSAEKTNRRWQSTKNYALPFECYTNKNICLHVASPPLLWLQYPAVKICASLEITEIKLFNIIWAAKDAVE